MLQDFGSYVEFSIVLIMAAPLPTCPFLMPSTGWCTQNGIFRHPAVSVDTVPPDLTGSVHLLHEVGTYGLIRQLVSPALPPKAGIEPGGIFAGI